jgi:hypothetical protein
MAKKKARKTVSKKARKASKIERMAAELEKLRRKLAKYEKRAAKKPPKRARVSQTKLDAVRGGMKLFLEQVKRGSEAEGLAVTYRTHENSDKSIDAELRLQLEDSGDIKDNLIRLEDSARWNELAAPYWVMMGVNAHDGEVTNSPTIDKRPNRAWTNPVRGNRSGAAFMTLRETVVDNLEAYFGSSGEFTLIVIRLYWHPSGAAPNRPRK